jgi:hypothetical protein
MKFINNIKNLIPNSIFNLRSNLFEPEKVLLGRWTIDYCDNKINKKLDLSNEDHCGTCNNKKSININEIIFFETI